MKKLSKLAVISSTLLTLFMGSQAQAFDSQKYIEWVHPQKSPMLYDFGVTKYSQNNNAYVGIKGGQATHDEIKKDEMSSSTQLPFVPMGDTSVSGSVDVTVSEHDKPTLYGIYGGYQWGNGFGVEAQYLQTKGADIDADTAIVDYDLTLNSGGDITTQKEDGYISNAEVEDKIIGLAGTYKYKPNRNSGFYIKGKLGGSYVESEQSYTINASKEAQEEALVVKREMQDELIVLNKILAMQSEDVGIPEFEVREKIRAAEAALNNAEILASGHKYKKKTDTTDWSAGIGVGYNFKNNMAVELQYERITKDIDAVALGVQYNF